MSENENGEDELDAHARSVLQLLNKEIIARDSSVEGNLFYHHKTALTVEMPPDITRLHKRRNFDLALSHARKFLEIGFNAGHSALLALAHFPRLNYIGIDIGENPYTSPCARIIEASFPGRARVIIGDSRIELPRLLLSSSTLMDAIHVDGGHDEFTAQLDLLHALLGTRSGGIVLMDDTLHPPIRAAVERVVVAGFATIETFDAGWNGNESLALRVARRLPDADHPGTGKSAQAC